jgi:hypothetical protein
LNIPVVRAQHLIDYIAVLRAAGAPVERALELEAPGLYRTNAGRLRQPAMRPRLGLALARRGRDHGTRLPRRVARPRSVRCIRRAARADRGPTALSRTPCPGQPCAPGKQRRARSTSAAKASIGAWFARYWALSTARLSASPSGRSSRGSSMCCAAPPDPTGARRDHLHLARAALGRHAGGLRQHPHPDRPAALFGARRGGRSGADLHRPPGKTDHVNDPLMPPQPHPASATPGTS